MNDMVTSHASHRFTVAEYHRLYEAGVFSPSSRTELIDGDVVESLVTMKPPHAAAVVEITRALIAALGDRATVRSQVPILLGEFSEPEPDITIARTSASKYADRHPESSDIFAIIEIADSSRSFDLDRKVPLYAAAGISETWVVDLIESRVHICRKPRDRAYDDTAIIGFDETASLEKFSDVALRIADLF